MTQAQPNSSTEQPRAIALLRVSTDQQDVARQRTAIERGILYHNLDITRWVTVEDVSGKHVNDDEQFQAIFRDLKTGATGGVIVAEQSRLVRPGDWTGFGILDHFRKNKRLIYTPSTAINPNTREGWYTLTVGGMISGDELQTLRERLEGGKQERRKVGKHTSGDQSLPRGVSYKRIHDPATGKVIEAHWEHDGVDSLLVKQAFQLLLQRYSYQDIARKIGNGWTGNGIRRAMQNPIWISIRAHRYECAGEEYRPKNPKTGVLGKRRKKTLLRAEPIEVPLDGKDGREYLEPLISREVFYKAQEIIDGRIGHWQKTKLKCEGRERHLATGLVFCSCGQRVYTKQSSRRPEVDIYRCASYDHRQGGCGLKHIKRVDLDAVIESALVTKLTDVKFMRKALAKATEMKQANPAQVKADAAIAGFERGRLDLLAMVRAGEITRDDFKREMATLERDKAALQASVPPPAPQIGADALVKALAGVFAEFAYLDFPAKRASLRRALSEIVVSNGEITEIRCNGGFLAGFNAELPSTRWFSTETTADVVLRFPEPIQITASYVDGRSKLKTSAEHKAALRIAKNARRRARAAALRAAA